MGRPGIVLWVVAVAAASLATVGLAEAEQGSKHADLLVGTKAGDELKGLRGHDVLIGGRGSDVLIGGRWVPAAGETYPVIDPATEEVVGRAPEASVAQAREAAHAAREAFERGPWPRMSAAERGACLRDMAARFREAARRLAMETTWERKEIT